MTEISPEALDLRLRQQAILSDFGVEALRATELLPLLQRATEPVQRDRLVRDLMDARRAVRAAKRSGDEAALVRARAAVDAAKHGLGERGPVWWTDGAPDQNRRMIANTPYAAWYAALPESVRADPVRRRG